MKITKFYNVLVDGKSVFCGSESQCKGVYDAIVSVSNIYNINPVIVIAYDPSKRTHK